MRYMIKYTSFLSLLLLLSACMSGKSQRSTSKQTYKEDLSEVRPKYRDGKDNKNPNEVSVKAKSTDDKNNIVVQKDVTKLLNTRLDTLGQRNKRLKLAQGYRVLVYTGNSSEEMKKVKLRLRSLLHDVSVYDEFKQPTFRVKAGDCFSRLEAYYVLNKIHKDFPNAIVVPDQINILKE